MGDRRNNEIEQKAEELLPKAMDGDKAGLTAELQKMSLEDQVAVARAMRDLSHKDDKLPYLEISTNTDSGGREHLQNITKIEERAWYNPVRWVAGHSDTEVYDAKYGSGSLSQVNNIFADRNRQLNEILNQK